MPTSSPGNNRKPPTGPVPARCLRCSFAALMRVQRIPAVLYRAEWHVNCPQCGDWRPGHPLGVPPKGDTPPHGEHRTATLGALCAYWQ